MYKQPLIALISLFLAVTSSFAQQSEYTSLKKATSNRASVTSVSATENTDAKLDAEDKILLPVEVMGAEGTITERIFTLTSEQANNSVLLWLQINNIGYENKVSVKVNGLDWVSLNHDSCNIQSPERERGGMQHGGHSTIRLTIPAVGFVDGLNTIRFRFNMSDAISSGFRVVRLNLLDLNKVKILDESYFVDEDPLTWKSPYYDTINNKEPNDLSSKVAQGKDYWYNAELKSNYLASGKKGFWYGYELGGQGPIKAKCASCHTQDGRDLEIFSYSNESIIERSKFHMLTEEEGKLIATYIRSLSEEHDNVGRYGRPWNPPYQPGPEIANIPIEKWAAGAGLDAVLQADKDMLPYMFPDGVDQEKVYDRFDSEKMVDRTILPIAIQFPDWKHWLPMIHPMDAYTKDDYWNDPLKTGGKSNIDPKKGYKIFRDYLEAMPPVNRNPSDLMKKNRDFWYNYRFFLAQRNDGATTLDGHWREKKSTATSKLGDGVPREFAATSLARLMAVQFFEIMNEFDLQDKAHWFVKPEDQPGERQWFGENYQIFEVPPHFQACVPDETNNIKGDCWQFHGQPISTGTYESTNWYHLQLIVNGGNGMVKHNSPMDYNYHPSFILKASNSSGIYEPLRYYHSLNAMYQFRSWSGGPNPNDGRGFRIRVQGPWHIIGRSDSHQLEGFAESVWPTFLDRVKVGMSKWILNAQLRQFLTEVQKVGNNLSNWNREPNGGSNELDSESKTTSDLKDMSDYTGLDYWADKFYYLFPEFAKLGVDCQILEEMIDWCEAAWPNINWTTFRNDGELQLSLLEEQSEDCSVNSNLVTAQTTNEGDNAIYEWWVNGKKIINGSDNLDTSDVRPGALVKCRVTSSKSCISNGWVESELTLPDTGFIVKAKINSGEWEEFNNSIACIDDTVEFMIDPELQDPLFWLDAMDVNNNNGTEPGNGNSVTRWFNKSSSGYALADQSNRDLRPTYNNSGMNGLPALMFGTNNANGLELFPIDNADYLNEDWTLIITGSYTRRGNWNCITGNEEGDSGFATYFHGESGRTRTKINGVQEHGRYYDDESDFVLMISKEGQKVKTYINGKLEVEVASSSSILSTSNAFYLGQKDGGSAGANYYHKGPISEVLFYDHIISNTQKNYIEGYLTQKWKFANELPLDHIYKEDSPLYMNLKTPAGETLVFDENVSSNTISFNVNEKFGNFEFTRPSCDEVNTMISVTNAGLIGDDIVRYSIDQGVFKIGNQVSITELESLELTPNYEIMGAYQWEQPDGTLLALNVNPDIYKVTFSDNKTVWKLHLKQDEASCVLSDQVYKVTLSVRELSESEKDDDLDGVKNIVDQCPNSIEGAIVNSVGCFDLPSNNFIVQASGETCLDRNNGSIAINAGATYNYTLTVDNSDLYNFTNDTVLEDLSPGTYSICITVEGEEDYKQCFNLTVDAAEAISGKSIQTKKGNIVTENMVITSGTAPYTISINGKNMLTTASRKFAIDVNHGDKISVSSKFVCEGELNNEVDLVYHFSAYPNPTTDFVNVVIPNVDLEEVTAVVYNSLHQKISEENYKLLDGEIRISLSNVSSGIYFLTLKLETPVNLKIVKK